MQKENWLFTIPFMCVRYFFVIEEVSLAADWHVSALHELGNATNPAQFTGV
jgi:hypothetical protein